MYKTRVCKNSGAKLLLKVGSQKRQKSMSQCLEDEGFWNGRPCAFHSAPPRKREKSSKFHLFCGMWFQSHRHLDPGFETHRNEQSQAIPSMTPQPDTHQHWALSNTYSHPFSLSWRLNLFLSHHTKWRNSLKFNVAWLRIYFLLMYYWPIANKSFTATVPHEEIENMPVNSASLRGVSRVAWAECDLSNGQVVLNFILAFWCGFLAFWAQQCRSNSLMRFCKSSYIDSFCICISHTLETHWEILRTNTKYW